MKSSEPGDRSPAPRVGTSEPRYVSLRPGTLAVTQLPAYSFEAEQYRVLSLQIEERFDLEDEGSHVLTIAGPDPGSGKTLTSLNLALILARRSERKVLLVEGDLWQPSFSSIFQLPEGMVGLSDLLRDEELDLQAAILTVWGTGLSLLTGGRRAEEGDLVTSRRMDELVAAMKSQFDLVIFDTPPFGLASSRYLTSFADSVVVVVRAEKTHRRSISETLDGLQPEQVAGLVLNDVRNRKRNYAYYSSYAAYYGAGYGEKPLGWRHGFWKRPLVGVASVAVVVGAIAASIFSLVRGKPAEVGLDPAWFVAGTLLILTLASWAVALSKWRPFGGLPESVEHKTEAVEESSPPAELEERSSVVTPMVPRPRADETTQREAEEIQFSPRPADLAAPDTDPMPANQGITIANLNIRRQPALDGEYVTTLQRGTPFEVLEADEDWLRVRAGEEVGWVAKLGTQLGTGAVSDAGSSDSTGAPAAEVSSETPAATGGARTSTNLNLRRLPGRLGEYLATLPEGTPLEVFAERDGWYRVRAGEQAGWVFGRGVEVGTRSRALGDDAEEPADPSTVPPKFLSWTAPSYRTTAESGSLGETLVAAVHVDESGGVLEVRLVESHKTDNSFNRAVRESLRSATFRPAFEDGVAVMAWHNVRVRCKESL